MEEQDFNINRWLLPFSWLYGMGVELRNKLFDWGRLRSRSFGIPTLCIGNLSVGGTGKTPHTEYLIKLLQQEGLNIGTLSRGYKRRSKGYILATAESNAWEIGDEPCQMKSKFPTIQVAVDEDRCHGIEQMMKLKNPPLDVILLDDAYQHRYVKAGLNILLTDYHRLFCDDLLLPAGRLREPASGKNRAQIIIVTKCPGELKPIDYNIIAKRLHLYPYQQLYFSTFRYGLPVPLFPKQAHIHNTFARFTGDEQVLLLTGIASPAPLIEEVRSYTPAVKTFIYDDHHDFSAKDLNEVNEAFAKMEDGNRLILTTEKDAARLKSHPDLPEELKEFIYVLPIEVEFLQDQQQSFNQNIINYVRTHSRNSGLPQR